MHRPALMRFALGMGMLMVVMLALTGCGGSGSAQEQAKGRPLPLYEKALSPGEYHSVEFAPPLSFEVGKGWLNTADQLSDNIVLGQQGDGPLQGDQTSRLHFANVTEVFKPGTTNVVDAPQDLVGWLQQHPYLNTSKPAEPVTVGGVKGEQFYVVVDHLPKDYYGNCGTDCLDIFYQSGGEQIGLFREGNKRRVIVLEDVKGDTVVIWYGGPPDTFDKFAPEAQKVVDSVKWSGS